MKTKQLKPSDFSSIYPWSSALQDAHSETVACNIMKILKRTGDEFRKLDWEEYKKERIKDGGFSEKEKSHFDKAVPYCEAAMTARLFSPEWNI